MKSKLKNYKDIVSKLRWSPEIEIEFPSQVDTDVLKERYKKLLAEWTVTDDSSLENGLEIKPRDTNKLYLNKESINEVAEILNIVRRRKGKVSKRCGLHIHICAKKLNGEEILKIVKEVIAKQQYIVKDLKVSSERLGQYCKYIKKSDIKGLTPELIEKFRKGETGSNLPEILNSKYFMLNLSNLSNFNTLEFRMMEGTTYLKTIKKNLNYLFNFLINALERD